MNMTLKKEIEKAISDHDIEALDSLQTYDRIRTAITKAVGAFKLTEGMLADYDAKQGIPLSGEISKDSWIREVIPTSEKRQSTSADHHEEVVHRIPVRVLGDSQY